MHAAGIVADHAAQRAAGMRGRVRAKGQLVAFGFLAQRVQNQTGLYPRAASFDIELQNAVHVFAEVDQHRGVATLAGKTGTTATRKNRRLVLATQRDGLDHVIRVFRQHHADRHLPVYRSVVGIQRAVARLETHFPVDFACQCRSKCARIDIMAARRCTHVGQCTYTTHSCGRARCFSAFFPHDRPRRRDSRHKSFHAPSRATWSKRCACGWARPGPVLLQDFRRAVS